MYMLWILCYGAFLLPYLMCLVLCAMPLYVLEVCAGQFSGFGAIKIWNICPLFKGIGITTCILISICAVYYIMIICWVIYYLIHSCAKVLPWSTCENEWNTPTCWIYQNIDTNSSITARYNQSVEYSLWTNENGTLKSRGEMAGNQSLEQIYWQNSSIIWTSPADEYWHNHALDLSPGIVDLGGLKWDLVGCLALAWLACFLCLFKGAESLGKVVYVSAPLPYLLLFILLIRGILLPGSLEGIRYYIIPDWSKLLQFKVWTEAGLQILYSIGPAWGTLFTMSSYNKFNSPCIRDAVCATLMGAGTSFFAGFVIFSVIGFMAFKTGLPIDDVVASGPGLAFIAYPEAISRMPLSPFWAILFFLMLVIVGINSEIFFVETTINCIQDLFPNCLKTKKELLVAIVTLFFFLSGLIMCTRAGMYVFLLIDWYVGAFSPFFIGIVECVMIVYIYGHNRFYSDIELMHGHKPSLWWKVCWGYICPIMLVIMSVYNLMALGEPYYRDYTYPDWVIIICLGFSLSFFLPVPYMMVRCLVQQQEGTMTQRIKASLKPTSEWKPSDEKIRNGYNYDPKIFRDYSILSVSRQNSTHHDKKETITLHEIPS